MGAEPEGRAKGFRSNLLNSLAETISTVRALNVTKDQALEQMADKAEQAIKGLDVDTLKEMPTAREQLKSKVDDILDGFSF